MSNLLGGEIGYWKLDEGTGTTATDSSGGGNNASFNGSPSWVSPTGSPIKFANPFAIEFTADGQWLNTGSVLIPDADYTLSCWFKGGDQTTGTGSIFRPFIAQPGDSGLGDEFSMARGGSVDHGKIRFRVGDGTTAVSASAYNDNQWHFAAGVRSGSDALLYVDGSLVGTGTVGTYSDKLSTRFGGDPSAGSNTRYFRGTLDDIRIFDRALTTAEIGVLAAGGPFKAPSRRRRELSGGLL